MLAVEYSLLSKPSYLDGRGRLDSASQRKVLKTEKLLAKDFRHPGLQTKKLQHSEKLYEARVDRGVRLVYSIDGDIIQLLAVGPHEIIDKRIGVPTVSEKARQAAAGSLVTPAPAAAPTVDYAVLSASSKHEAGMGPGQQKKLPEVISDELLEELSIDSSFHAELVGCETEERLLDAPVPAAVIEALLEHFYPKTLDEIIEEPDLVVRSPEDLQRHSDGELIEFLLRLDDEQEAAVARAIDGPAMVKGGPGTGKSTVALYRAAAVVKKAVEEGRPVPRVLFTTYTNSLVEASRQLIERLLGDQAEAVEVTTIDSVARSLVRGKKIARDKETAAALDTARSGLEPGLLAKLESKIAAQGLATVRDTYLLDEFEWVIEGRAIETGEEYRQADRRGRGYALDGATRQAVWSMYEAFRKVLDRDSLVTWKRLSRLALEEVREKEIKRYDYVVIDEAQDLAPVALVLAVELCRDARAVFFAADGCQSIYNRGFRFSHIHDSLDLRGRSTVLKRNYRSTREIAAAAADLLRGSEAADPEVNLLEAVHSGKKPEVLKCEDVEGQARLLARKVKDAAIELRMPLSACAVLCATNKVADGFCKLLNEAGLPAVRTKGKDLQLDEPGVKVMTIHTAKGLEFPMIAVARVEEGLLPRPIPGGSEDEEEHMRVQLRLLFVGCTRAMRRLWVCTTEGNESRFLDQAVGDSWRHGADASD